MEKVYSAPSNIAIIKYMGKTSSAQNLPTNPSISYTLNHLRSFVSLELISDSESDQWQPLIAPGLLPIELSEKGKIKFLNHLKRVKEFWKIEKNFIVRSANNFPSDCGIASSSSSFAALTLAAADVCNQLNPLMLSLDKTVLSGLSRQGSGSSCRSFFEPWAVWRSEFAEPWVCSFNFLNHSVLLLDSSPKDVSSSEAHWQVTSSPLFPQRLINVKERLSKLEGAMEEKNWNYFCDLAFEEFEEMHQLFETSQPKFSYRTDQTMKVLSQLKLYNQGLENKILITMDAGNNIHCLSLSSDQLALKKLEDVFPKIVFINSWDSHGGLNG